MAKNFCALCVSFIVAATVIVAYAAPASESHRLEKRSPDDKRVDALMNDLASALGSMQRPRFGKRFYAPERDQLYNEKKSNAFADLESALGSMQRPRFG